MLTGKFHVFKKESERRLNVDYTANTRIHGNILMYPRMIENSISVDWNYLDIPKIASPALPSIPDRPECDQLSVLKCPELQT